LPKLRDFDWRLDVKISSKTQDRLKLPTLYVKMDLEKDQSIASTDAASAENTHPSQALFQVSKGQLKEILNNFEVINKQLTSLTSQGA